MPISTSQKIKTFRNLKQRYLHRQRMWCFKILTRKLDLLNGSLKSYLRWSWKKSMRFHKGTSALGTDKTIPCRWLPHNNNRFIKETNLMAPTTIQQLAASIQEIAQLYLRNLNLRTETKCKFSIHYINYFIQYFLVFKLIKVHL